MVAHINIGTNLGDRMANISRAVALISTYSHSVPRLSSIITSKPWGYDSENQFMNQGVEIETNLSPDELVRLLKIIESEIDNSPHRDSNGNYADRVIDIDLIYLDSVVYTDADVQVPHPRMQFREFVLKPIVELSPNWKHPVLNKTATELLKEIK